ncbi:DUF3127 domain-containing protein [Verrucomicrobiales bacterium]|nr:DUF3127 domain-containing protein [Verrucomicrobiales bacterium]
MAGYELSGTVKEILDLQTFQSGFTKREFVVTTEDGKYSNDIKFETVRDKTSLLDGISKGDTVNVTFDVRGNEYNGRYYVNLNAWKVTGGGGGGGAAPAAAAASAEPIDEMPPGYGQEDEDDIPF